MIEEIAQRLSKSQKCGSGYIACCPAHEDRRPSLSLSQKGKKVLFKCHAGCTQDQVMAALRSKGLWPLLESRESLKGRGEIKAILAGSKSLNTTDSINGVKYLKARGLEIPERLPNIRFHSSLPYYEGGLRMNLPALIGTIQKGDGSICGLQRIYLSTKGKKASVGCPKKVLGRTSGGAIRLVEPKCELALTEGIETALSVLQATGLPTWSCVSANGLEKVQIPQHVNTVRIFADKDKNNVGERAASRLAKRLRAEGKEVYVHVPPGELEEDQKSIDWLDVLNSQGNKPFEDSLRDTGAFNEKSSLKPKPEVIVNGRQQSDLLTETWEYVVEAQKEFPCLFLSGNNLTKVKTLNGRKKLTFINAEEFREYLVRLIDWKSAKITEGGTKISHAKLPMNIVGLLFNVPDNRLPYISMVTRVPYINRRKEFVFTNGYDFDSKIFLDTNIDFRQMFLEELSPDKLREKKNLLLNDLLGDFPFKNESHKINFLSCLLLPLVRNLFDLAPIYIVDASLPGSGKTLLSQIFSIILFGEQPQALPFSKGQNEQRKTITSRLSEGNADLIFFDNLPSGALDSGIIAYASTQKYWTDRILGFNKTVTFPNTAVWILTGNQLRPTTELVRRTPYIRLESGSSQPWKRSIKSFKHKNILAWAKENRLKLLSALLYLVRYWHHHGLLRADNGIRLGSFEEWSSIMNGIFQTTGIQSFLETHSEDSKWLESLSEGSDLTSLFTVWWKNFKEREVSVSDLLGRAEIRWDLSELTGHFNSDALMSETGKLLKRSVGVCCASWKLNFKQTSKGGKKYYLKQAVGEEGALPSHEGEGNVLSF